MATISSAAAAVTTTAAAAAATACEYKTTTAPEVLYRLTKTAQFHPKLRENSNGLDLPLQDIVRLEPLKIVKVNLGICVQFPPDFCGLLVNKSSAITLFETKVYFGLIDNGYTNELQAVIQNISDHTQILPAGIAIVQLLVIPAPIPKFTLCQTDELPKSTNRGGFGSTGQHFERV
jgi:dUTP pyrophosphatase